MKWGKNTITSFGKYTPSFLYKPKERMVITYLVEKIFFLSFQHTFKPIFLFK